MTYPLPLGPLMTRVKTNKSKASLRQERLLSLPITIAHINNLSQFHDLNLFTNTYPNNPERTNTNHKRSTPHSGEDVPNEIGSTASLNNDLSENSVELTSAGEMFDAGQHWEMNYHEAAIFLEVLEGENNEKFDSHPHNSAALPAYLLVHNRWYYGLDMATSIILLTLAFVEEPALPLFKLPVAVHGSIELLALIIIGVELTMKLRWIGWRTILKHKRTMTKGITLGIMFVEAVTVLVRQSSHFRVTRALRPIFLVDTCHCGGVRRFIRQIFQSLPPILDMLGLLMFFISIYALLGYYLFSGEPRTEHFTTLHDSFVSMFVLLTTANFPDVMMPLYAKSKWYSVFFISYLCIVLYILMNLMLAVVYETFTRIEREKFRKLLLHKRKACQHAYRLLVSKQNPNKIRFKQFEGLMRYFAPKKMYAVEAMLRVLGLGLTQYFNSGWNVYDFSVTLGTFLGVIILYMAPWFVYVVVLRPLRLLRLFKLKKRYRDVFGTLVLLTPLMCSTAIVMLVMYYFFSIIGMELFAGYDMRNCCVNTTVEDFYKWSSNSTTALGYYYLNTFDDLMTSGVTLFELTIVNNWFILMNSYAVMVSPWSRGYFMLFYLFTMVVLTIVVASVLEAFRFRIQYKRQTTKREEEKMLHEEVHLKWEEMQSWVQDFQLLERLRADLIVGHCTPVRAHWEVWAINASASGFGIVFQLVLSPTMTEAVEFSILLLPGTNILAILFEASDALSNLSFTFCSPGELYLSREDDTESILRLILGASLAARQVKTEVYRGYNILHSYNSIESCDRSDRTDARPDVTTVVGEKHAGPIVNLTKENAHIMVLAFDFQQNLPLPKVPAGEAFYLHQLWVYNFCIHSAKNVQAHFYIYDETPNETVTFLSHCNSYEFIERERKSVRCAVPFIWELLGSSHKTILGNCHIAEQGSSDFKHSQLFVQVLLHPQEYFNSPDDTLFMAVPWGRPPLKPPPPPQYATA
uniref:Ion transport domain-containing protein n=1 Tax=Timema bartmani TaxID=61472 RepID=A0A7R9EP94_9NEOP|nr:unnamed protein product [Timema bartmani]